LRLVEFAVVLFQEPYVKLFFILALPALLLHGLSRGEELPSAIPKAVGLSPEKLERVTALARASVAKKQTSGAVVLIARHGKVAYLEGFGTPSVSSAMPMPKDAIFRIHSMSKPITTVAALTLFQDGKFKLDDPVSRYLPAFKEQRVHTGKGDETIRAEREMTIRDLLRHTSGLVYGMPNGSAVDKLYLARGIDGPRLSLEEMVDVLGKLPLQDQPGARFNYSISTDVLARLIEVVSGKPIDEFLRDRVFWAARYA
jgi:CubicO group peptidase (beta-lactamase class C family)